MSGVLCVGEALIDFISVDNGFSISDSSGFKKEAGGAPLNVACTVNHFGGRAALATAVGDDSFGRYLEDFITFYGVDKTFLQTLKKHSTTLAFVSLMKNGERDFEFMRGADSFFTIKEKDLKKYSEYDLFHFGSATAFLGGQLEKSYKLLFDMAVSDGKIISFDPNYRSAFWHDDHRLFKSKILSFMQEASIIKLSDEELRIITGESDIEDGVNLLYQENPALYCITLGKKGTYIRNESISTVVPSIEVNPVDTTGAGDGFIGALLYKISSYDDPGSLIAGVGIIDEIKFANKVGAMITTKKGALSALPSL